jgi:DNA polymerase III sliding clamp (beta) subunit (PCNA family)
MTPLVVNSGVFARALSQVEVSISTDKYRLNLSGAHVSSEDEYIILSSTDSYRMSQVAVPGTVNFTGILPGSVVHGLTGYLSGEDDLAIDIGVDKLSAQIVAGRLSVTTRLVNASFPDFTTVIAKAEENDNLIVVNRKDFVRVLRQATLLFDKEKPRASISVATNDDNEAEISVGSFSDLGEAENCVYGVVKDGGSFSISVNPAYLVAGLEHFDSEVVRFSSSGNGKGVCALTSDSDEFMYLFMPYNS